MAGYHALQHAHATRSRDAIYPSLYLSCARRDDGGPEDLEVALAADDLDYAQGWDSCWGEGEG